MSQSSPVGQSSEPSRGSGCLVAVVAAIVLLAILFVVVALALFIIFPSVTQPPRPAPPRTAALGQKMPQVALQPLFGPGKAVTLDELAGKVVLINFWGTWCPPCRLEIPHLAKLESQFRDHPDFRFFAVSCPPPDAPEDGDLDQLRHETETFLRSVDIQLPGYADPKMVTRNAFDQIGQFRGYPTTLAMDRRGVVRAVWAGFFPEVPDEMTRVVRELLDEPATRTP